MLTQHRTLVKLNVEAGLTFNTDGRLCRHRRVGDELHEEVIAGERGCDGVCHAWALPHGSCDRCGVAGGRRLGYRGGRRCT